MCAILPLIAARIIFTIIMKRSIRNKCIAVGNSVLLLVQSLFSPWVGILLAATPSNPVANIIYTQATNEINLSVSTKNKVQYVLSYRLASGKIDGVQGEDKQNPEFTKTVFIGSCSSDSCINQRPEKGIAKYASAQDSWTYRQMFIVENGNLQVISEGPADAVTISDDEMKWLESPDKSPPASPTPTVVPEPTQNENKLLLQSSVSSSSVISIDNKCMEDLYGSHLNCTANDVSIASVSAVQILDADGGCTSPDDTVQFKAIWDVQSTSTQRYNVGLYFATAGQTSALNGSCSISSLPYAPVPPWFDFDNNMCGDIASSSQVHPEITMTVKCADPDGNNVLNVPYCTSWEQNSSTCTGPLNTVPGAPSKCNCENGFQVPITVPYAATVEVIKKLTPTDDAGRFTLYVDESTKHHEVENIGNGTTGQIIIGAGTSVNPSSTIQVGETAYTGTTLSDYGSTISCVDRGKTTYDGGPAKTQNGSGPLSLPVGKNDDIVCTITNTRNAGNIEIVKDVTPDDPSTGWDFAVNGSRSFSSTIYGDGTTGAQYAPLGTYEIVESAHSGTNGDAYIPSWSCTKNSLPYGSGNGRTISGLSVGAVGDLIVCTFTNTKLHPSLQVVKSSTTTAITHAGQIVDYSFAVTNTGNQVLSGLTVTDPKCDSTPTYISGDTNADSKLQTTETWTYTCNHTVSADELTAGGNLVNTVTADSVESDPDTDTYSIPITVGKIIIEKQTLPDGSNTSFEFVPSWSGSHFTLRDGQTNDSGWMAPGTYSVSEIVPSGWDLTNAVCSDQSPVSAISVSSGETVTCVFSNTQRGSITIRKNTLGGNGTFSFTSTALPTHSFSITTTAQTGSANFSNIVPGTYDITETIPSGWILSPSLTCSDPDGGSTVNASKGLVTVDLDPGESITCTFINNKLPKLTVIKHVINDNGGTKKAGDFTMRVSGTSLPTPSSFAGSESGTIVGFTIPNSGTYSVDEDAVYGYQKTIGSGCSGTIDWGVEKTCTITNDDIAPKLHLRKSVINDNGGSSDATDWILSATGSSQIVSYLMSPSPADSNIFFQADTYTLSESAGSGGYTPSQWSCVLNSLPPVLGSTITLGVGDEATCTITNDDKQGTIHLHKDVVAPDGTTDVSDDHTFTVEIDNSKYDISESSPKDISLNSGLHTLTELPDSAYVYAGIWGVTDLDLLTEGIQFITLPGQIITITVINKQTLGSISGQKYADVNGNGIKDPSEQGISGWTITLDKNADGSVDQTTTTDAAGNYSFTNLDLATYKVREVAQSGYSQTSVDPSDITLASGQSVSNVDFGNMPLGSITITKVDSQNTGTDFSFSIQKFGSASTPFILDDDDGQDVTYSDSKTFDNLVPDFYTISENSVSDWTQSVVECRSDMNTPNPQNEFGEGTMSVALRPGEHMSCTFTNTRDTGTITLNKVWSGPGKQVLLAIGTTPNGDQIASIKTGENGTEPLSTDTKTVNTGTYYVSESGDLTDFTTMLECTDNKTPVRPGINNSLTVAKDHTVVCTFTNTRKTLPLYVTKFEDANMNALHDEGEPELDGWTMDLYDNSTCSGTPIQSVVTDSSGFPGTARFNDLYQGVTYFVKEVEQSPDWTITTPNCQGYTIHDDIHSNNQMQFGNFHFASVSGYKFEDANNNAQFNDGESYLDDWVMHLYGKNSDGMWEQTNNATTGTAGQTGHYEFSGLSLGEYKICEVNQTGWNQTYPVGTNGGSDQEALNCHFFTVTGSGQTFTADFGNVHFGSIVVSKYNDVDGDGTRDDNEPLLNDWEINLDGIPSQLTGSGDNEDGKVRFEQLAPETYYLSETMQSGWKQTAISCKSGIGVKITAQGEAYGHHGYCSGWNQCGNAQTCAQWACEVNGYSTLVSYGDERPCTQFNNCNLFYSRGSIQMNWGNWCGVMGVTDIVCTNGTTPTPTPTPTESPLTGIRGVFSVQQVHAQEAPSGHAVVVNPGETVTCEIGNQYVPPELTIEKYNTIWPTAIGPGSDVSYAIVITAKNNRVYNVKVKDLLPKGFVYKKGSWSATSSIHGNLAVAEPTYASPGTWTLTANSGDNIYPYIEAGELITLRMKASTDSGLDPGIYKDIAWAVGTAELSSESEMVLADSVATDKNVDPGVVTEAFVGTQVQLDTSRHNSVSMNVIHEETRTGEVLGASTELPATGARSIWLMIAAMSILSGIGCLYMDKRNRRLHA